MGCYQKQVRWFSRSHVDLARGIAHLPFYERLQPSKSEVCAGFFMRCLVDQSTTDVCSVVLTVVVQANSSELVAKRQCLPQHIQHVDLP